MDHSNIPKIRIDHSFLNAKKIDIEHVLIFFFTCLYDHVLNPLTKTLTLPLLIAIYRNDALEFVGYT